MISYPSIFYPNFISQAGLQLTPNATRLFQRWGIYDNLSVQATSHKSLTVRRFDGSKILAHEPCFQDKILSRYQAPFWGMHRVDLQRTLVARCQDIGVQIHYHSRVIFVDFDSAEVEIEPTGGNKVKGEVVIGADGIWSATRSQFLANSRPAKPTGDLAYRIVIHVSDLSGPDAPELRKFIQDQGTNFWIGPGSHAVAYAMRATTVYNIVLLCPDDLPEGTTKIGGNLLEMNKLFEQWDPLLQKFLNQVKSPAKWRLTYLDANAVPEWTNAKGTFIMAGDSCHAMLPYLAQGANTSLEDGAVLGYLLGKVSQGSKERQLPRVAQSYRDLRKGRVEMIQREAFGQRGDFHLEDGPEQQARDALMTEQLLGETRENFPSRWTCPKVQNWLYGYDAYHAVEQSFETNPF